MSPLQLIQQLVDCGGAIVSSNDCGQMEIADARARGRFAVDSEGLGFVRRPKEWLARIHREDDYPGAGYGRPQAENAD